MAEYEIFVDVGRETDQMAFAASPAMEGRQIRIVTVKDLVSKANQETEVELRDPLTVENFKARVIFSPHIEDLPGADTLWLVSIRGKIQESPWAVRILERIDEEETEVTPLPRRRLSLDERRGKILEELLRERKGKTKGA